MVTTPCDVVHENKQRSRSTEATHTTRTEGRRPILEGIDPTTYFDEFMLPKQLKDGSISPVVVKRLKNCMAAQNLYINGHITDKELDHQLFEVEIPSLSLQHLDDFLRTLTNKGFTEYSTTFCKTYYRNQEGTPMLNIARQIAAEPNDLIRQPLLPHTLSELIGTNHPIIADKDSITALKLRILELFLELRGIQNIIQEDTEVPKALTARADEIAEELQHNYEVLQRGDVTHNKQSTMLNVGEKAVRLQEATLKVIDLRTKFKDMYTEAVLDVHLPGLGPVRSQDKLDDRLDLLKTANPEAFRTLEKELELCGSGFKTAVWQLDNDGNDTPWSTVRPFGLVEQCFGRAYAASASFSNRFHPAIGSVQNMVNRFRYQTLGPVYDIKESVGLKNVTFSALHLYRLCQREFFPKLNIDNTRLTAEQRDLSLALLRDVKTLHPKIYKKICLAKDKGIGFSQTLSMVFTTMTGLSTARETEAMANPQIEDFEHGIQYDAHMLQILEILNSITPIRQNVRLEKFFGAFGQRAGNSEGRINQADIKRFMDDCRSADITGDMRLISQSRQPYPVQMKQFLRKLSTESRTLLWQLRNNLLVQVRSNRDGHPVFIAAETDDIQTVVDFDNILKLSAQSYPGPHNQLMLDKLDECRPVLPLAEDEVGISTVPEFLAISDIVFTAGSDLVKKAGDYAAHHDIGNVTLCLHPDTKTSKKAQQVFGRLHGVCWKTKMEAVQQDPAFQDLLSTETSPFRIYLGAGTANRSGELHTFGIRRTTTQGPMLYELRHDPHTYMLKLAKANVSDMLNPPTSADQELLMLYAMANNKSTKRMLERSAIETTVTSWKQVSFPSTPYGRKDARKPVTDPEAVFNNTRAIKTNTNNLSIQGLGKQAPITSTFHHYHDQARILNDFVALCKEEIDAGNPDLVQIAADFQDLPGFSSLSSTDFDDFLLENLGQTLQRTSIGQSYIRTTKHKVMEMANSREARTALSRIGIIPDRPNTLQQLCVRIIANSKRFSGPTYDALEAWSNHLVSANPHFAP